MKVSEVMQVAVLQAYLDGDLDLAEACERLGKDRTTVWRRAKRLEEEGPEGLAHGLRGRPGNRHHDLSVRKAGETEFTQKTKKFGTELFRDMGSNRLLYVCESASLSS